MVEGSVGDRMIEMSEKFKKLQDAALKYYFQGEGIKAYNKWEEALNCCVTPLSGDTASTLWNNLGLAKSLTYPGEGIDEYTKAATVATSQANRNEAKWNLSLSLLYNNEHIGWLLYESRFLRTSFDSVKFTELPIPYISVYHDSTKSIDENIEIWLKSNIDNRHLLILDEQGFGDSIMFASVWREIAKRAKSVVFQCKSELLTLFQNSFSEFKNVELIGGTTLPAQNVLSRDAYIYAGTAFGMMCNKYISTNYLKPSVKSIDKWKEIFKLDLRKKIGFNLSSNPKSRNSMTRSITDESLQKSIAMNYISGNEVFIPLSPSATRFANLNNIRHDVKSNIVDFEDVASIMMLMDDIVSVSTASAHLAGAIGVNAKIYYHDDTNEWRWNKNWRNKDNTKMSLIYPHVELIEM